MIALIILIPFLGTILGSAFVFFLKDKISERLETALLGFAAGVMIAASVWSLIIPSIEASSSMGKWSFIPAAVGFLIGIAFLLGLDLLVPHLHMDDDHPEGMASKLKKTTMLALAVTIHNLPEGMSTGIAFASIQSGNSTITLWGAIALAIGIALQNIPEGAIVSMNLKINGEKKSKSFLIGALSGVVEPIGAVLSILLFNISSVLMPYLLAFAAGAMMFVVVEELIPESQNGKHRNISTIGVAIGFVVMMILDITLG